MKKKIKISNPFRPGAGHMPPYLAGREAEHRIFKTLLQQKPVLKNLILTGLRGVGKTVLLETFKPMAIQAGWGWAGTDLSESCAISEDNMALRLLTDLSLVTGGLVIATQERSKMGFSPEVERKEVNLSFSVLRQYYENTPGLVSDKLKAVLEALWPSLNGLHPTGIVFAYDEAQNLEDHSKSNQYPLSLLLDVFQSLQRKNLPYLLILTGLPTLFPKLVKARTFAERMFTTIFLNSLGEEETKIAIRKPLECYGDQFDFLSDAAHNIWLATHGYPYFIQYVCREAFDVWLQAMNRGDFSSSAVPIQDIIRKLDSDFFAGRWARATDRQRELLEIISNLKNCNSEFTVQEIVEYSKLNISKPFKSSHVNQMLSQLADAGLIYKNRHGKYSFAVPLLGDFIQRQMQS